MQIPPTPPLIRQRSAMLIACILHGFCRLVPRRNHKRQVNKMPKKAESRETQDKTKDMPKTAQKKSQKNTDKNTVWVYEPYVLVRGLVGWWSSKFRDFVSCVWCLGSSSNVDCLTLELLRQRVNKKAKQSPFFERGTGARLDFFDCVKLDNCQLPSFKCCCNWDTSLKPQISWMAVLLTTLIIPSEAPKLLMSISKS